MRDDVLAARYPFLFVALRIAWGLIYCFVVVPLVFGVFTIPVWIGLQYLTGYIAIEHVSTIVSVAYLAAACYRRYAPRRKGAVCAYPSAS